MTFAEAMAAQERAEAWNAELRTWLQTAATEAGFDAAGIAAAEPPEERAGGPDRFTEWIDAGRAGEMDWLKRRDEQGALLRSAVRVALPWARSVIVCAMNYHQDAPLSIDPAEAGEGWIGRYAWSGRRVDGELRAADYHDDLLARLRTLEAGLALRASCETRCYVDTGPLVERDAAARAGVGWIGKNTCVLREGLGSWMLMGVLVTSLPTEPRFEPTPAADRCGSCTRCLEACPTGALTGPRQMDASLCIAYLTIEKKGAIAEELRGAMGRQVFGCDICQDVCPWNRRAPIAVKAGLELRGELVNPALAWLAGLDSAGFRRLFRGSPLERTGRRRLQRNVAIAMGNSGETTFLAQLQMWAEGTDEMLAEAANWAIGRLRPGGVEVPPGEQGAAAVEVKELGGGRISPGGVLC